MMTERLLNTAILAFHLVVQVRLHVDDVGCWTEFTEVSIVEYFLPWVAYFQSGTKTHCSNNKKDPHFQTVTNITLILVDLRVFYNWK